jgi:hypothetical protein
MIQNSSVGIITRLPNGPNPGRWKRFFISPKHPYRGVDWVAGGGVSGVCTPGSSNRDSGNSENSGPTTAQNFSTKLLLHYMMIIIIIIIIIIILLGIVFPL